MRFFVSSRAAAAARLSCLAVALLGLVPLAAGLSGCGGGSVANAIVNAPTTRARLDINWAARSRAVDAPASALSARVTLTGINPLDGGPVEFVVNRRDDPAAYSETVTSPAQVRSGLTNVVVRFFAGKDASGGLVAEARKNNALIAPDGSGIGGISTDRKIASVEVAADQRVVVGDTVDLAVTVKGEGDSTLAVPVGAIVVAVTGGDANLQANPNGSVTGKALGAATVTASVDGVVSAAQTVTVVPKAVTIPAGQKIRVSEPTALNVVATDKNDQPVPVPGGVLLDITGGGEFASIPEAGKLAGLQVTPLDNANPNASPLKVKATILGVASAAQDVIVDFGPEVRTASGLGYQEITLANGATPAAGQRVRVRYAGYFTDGRRFDPPAGSPNPFGEFTFIIDAGQVVSGFNEGVRTMKVGGSRRLLVPSALGYGAVGSPPNIPPNTDLVFDVQLVGIE